MFVICVALINLTESFEMGCSTTDATNQSMIYMDDFSTLLTLQSARECRVLQRGFLLLCAIALPGGSLNIVSASQDVKAFGVDRIALKVVWSWRTSRVAYDCVCMSIMS